MNKEKKCQEDLKKEYMEVMKMKKCKWAGDMGDEYCKNCNGVTMEVEGRFISCENCAGYEAGEEDAISDDVDMTPTKEDKQVVEDAAKKLNKNSDNIEEELPFSDDEDVTNNVEKTTQISTKTKKTNNNTPKKEKAEESKNTSIKVSEEKHKEEESEYTPTGIHVTSLRYTSGVTIKKGDNYFKFIAEEEWDVSQAKQDIQDVREQLWAKLNAEVDAQIEELNNMN